MSKHETHPNHDHAHGPGCGHPKVAHDGHEDFLHDGHLHHVHGDHVDEHALAVDSTNPAACTPGHAAACTSHAKDHVHGDGCGHAASAHGDPTDYVVAGHLHHPHAQHCDDHGTIALSA